MAQTDTSRRDTTARKALNTDTALRRPLGFGASPFQPLPDNFTREVEFDARSQRYIIRNRIGGRFYSTPQYLTLKEYQALLDRELKQKNWKANSDEEVNEIRQGLVPQINVKSKAFQKIFGGSTIDIQPRGEAELNTVVRINKNQNPLFNEKQRTQVDLDFDQRIQMNLLAAIGTNLKMKLNYNTNAGFDFENQKKLEYTGGEDAVIQKIELGNVSMPLNSSLIRGSQSLFGVKTQLQLGRLNLTSVFSQQKSVSSDIRINNGAQQNDFNISADNYETNKHYFLAQYFRENYNKFSSNPSLISSGVNITKVEVWITNKSGSTTDSRNVLALLDLGENSPWNTAQLRGGQSALPSAFVAANFPRPSNDLQERLPAGSRLSNSNELNGFFAANGGTDNFAKMTYARRLQDTEFSYHAQLGYISLSRALNADEILAVAYRYTENGIEYQVGEFSTDVPFNPQAPNMLYAKLLKNETIKTQLPTWDLMMKNIYAIGGYKINPANFIFNITRLENSSGVESPVMLEGRNTANKRWLTLTRLDLLNQQQDLKPDGIFDFKAEERAFALGDQRASMNSLSNSNTALTNLINSSDGVRALSFNTNGQQGYITIDPLNGRIIFPLIEPFGKDLASQFTASEQALVDKYTFQALYDSTKVVAQQLFPSQNRFVLRGSYESAVSSEYYLNVTHVEPGGVKVYSGNVPLVEGVDFAVDYQSARVTILNPALLVPGQSLHISTEDSDSFGREQRTVFGSHLDYKVSNKLNLGATFMSLRERPISQKVNYGFEPLSNSMWGMDLSYSTSSKTITRWLNKLPFVSTKVPSAISFSGEFARLQPGHPAALNTAGQKSGVSYLDDFEDSESVIDLKAAAPWQLSGTPQLFPESALMNDLAYGFNRAKLAVYTIDPTFYEQGNRLQPVNLANNKRELSNHFVRQVTEQEVFPFKELPVNVRPDFPILDMVFYPTIRGPYNYTTSGVSSNGRLQLPRSRWGGIIRRIESSDFEALNVGYIEMWVMDPNIYKPNSAGGDLYLNLGNISEDILKDGRKSLENGLPADGDPAKYEETVWGRVPKLQPVIPTFENNPAARAAQDVGLDGLSNVDEQAKFTNMINQLRGQLNGEAVRSLNNDPSSDDYQYFRGAALDQSNAGILKRYESYNNPEGNSKTSEQSRAELGVDNAAATALPDGEDVNRDNNMTQSDEYFQYKVSLRPSDLVVGKNFVTDKVVAQVKLANGNTQATTWYQIRVPIGDYEQKVGAIPDFKSIRFIRMFMTNFEDTAVVRFAKLQLVRGDWRQYNPKNEALQVIADPAISPAAPDQSSTELSTINIEENGRRSPIPYVLPPDIARERDFSNFRGDTKMNEQSLVLTVKNLKDGYSRAAFKNGFSDFRSYKRLEMFVHLEAVGTSMLNDRDLSAVLRIGTDHQDNYYEYVQPLLVTAPGSSTASTIWPDQNKIDILLELFQRAKIARNRARTSTGAAWDLTVPFPFQDGERTVYVKGQPDMSKVRIYMLGLKNSLQGNGAVRDDGLEKSASVWFNELRLTEFDERGGWAATARLNAKLADIGELNVISSKSTVGFGALDARISERSRADQSNIDVSAAVELGKLLPAAAQLKIPTYINYSRQVITPQYDPSMPDIELKKSLEGASSEERKAILDYAHDVTTRNGISFTNVHKERSGNSGKARIWDIENFSASYAFSRMLHHDFINASSVQKTYNGSIAYSYAGETKNIRPFDKLIKSNMLTILKDINFNPLPNAINLRMDMNRYSSENSLRNTDPLKTIPVNTTYNKNFLVTRVYGISWNLTRSFTVDFDATNYSIIDEPENRLERLKTDSVRNGLLRMGRNTDYSHNLNLSYTLPLNKLPYMDWFNVVARYGSNFNWQTEPLATLRDPNINLGNTIQNSRTVQLNPSLNFVTLYNKFGSYRRGVSSGYDHIGGSQFLIDLLTSIKTINGAYTQTKGIYLPGYLPGTRYLGLDGITGAPGLGFVFGSQRDIRDRALNSGWITTDTLQYQLYVNTLREDVSLSGVLEPLKGFRITLSVNKTNVRNYSSNFRYDAGSSRFGNLSPVTNGDYSISFVSIKTLFADKGGSKVSSLYRNFMDGRAVISKRLGSANPNSRLGNTTFADGYDQNSQDVIVGAFIAAYTGKNPYRSELSSFPRIPLPNWRINYNGLSKLPFFAEYVQSLDLRHAYRSIYSVNGYNSLQRYEERSSASSVRDENMNFLPRYQFSQVTIAETLSPLIGVDARFKNNLSMNIEIGKARMLGLSLANSQLAQLSENNLVLGMGYRTTRFRFPFGLFSGMRMDNNVDFKLESAIRNNQAVIYRADVDEADISSGAKIITMRPSINYILNSRFNFQLYYDTNITKPYTSAAFRTSSSNLGFSLRMTMQ